MAKPTAKDDVTTGTSAASRKLLTALTVLLAVAAAGMLVWTFLARSGVVKGPGQVAEQVAIKGLPLVKSKASKAYLEKDDPSEKLDSLGPRNWKIVDIHEHVQSEKDALLMLDAMDKLGVQRSCILAATIYTFTLNNKYGFEGFKENNEEVIRLRNKYPERLCGFVTLDPAEDGNLERLRDYAARGADGLKLYLGHGAKTGKGPFHVMPLADPRMDPIWSWAEETQFPIVMHVNLIKYWDEFLRMMEKHPYLRMNIPHFGLHKNSEQRLKRLEFLLKRYPNLYTDMSYGYYTFQVEGFEALSKFRSRSKQFLIDNREKILFASDMVLEPTKDEPYIINTLRSYMQWTEREKFRFFYVPDRTMHGMGLDNDTLSWIYEKAPANFLLTDAKGMLPDRTKGWPAAGTPEPPRPALPPLDVSKIPPDKQAKPSDSPTPAGTARPGEDDGDAKGAGCEHEPWDDDGL